MRAILEPTGKATNAAVFALLLVICWNQWSGHSVGETSVYRFGSRIVAVGCVALLYVLEALFFAHGEARAVET
jgi:hypothetical protein